MLVRDDLLQWFQQLGLPEQTRTIIDTIRSSSPARRAGGGKSNVSGRYPSRKMGVSIQFEGHRVELAGIYEMEHDPEVLEYYDQPSTIKLDYESAAGKRIGVLHTPDFFVIRKNEAGWEEWKTAEDLARLSEHNSNRYCPGAGGEWCCPPGIAYAERLGLCYRVRSSSEIDWMFQRNIQFLDDYLRGDPPEIALTSRDIAMAYLTAMPDLSLADLLQLTKDKISPDDIFAMIAADVLCVDWRAAPLAEPSRVKVFSIPDAMRQHEAGRKPDLLVPMARLRCGSEITWDGCLWRVVDLGDTSLSLLSEDHKLTELPTSVFAALIRENRVQIADDPSGAATDSAIRDRLSRASEADLQMATYRSSLISSYRDLGTLPTESGVTRRTFFR